jgi:hypothetical protein
LASTDAKTLRTVLARNVYGHENPEHEGADRLAHYMMGAIAAVSQQSGGTLQEGTVQFPVPA